MSQPIETTDLDYLHARLANLSAGLYTAELVRSGHKVKHPPTEDELRDAIEDLGWLCLQIANIDLAQPPAPVLVTIDELRVQRVGAKVALA